MPTSYTEIPLVNLVKGNPLNVEVDSDKSPLEWGSQYFELHFADGGPVNDETFTLTYGTLSVTFTFKSSPGVYNSTQLPLQSVLPIDIYVDVVMAKIALHSDLKKIFTFSRLSSPDEHFIMSVFGNKQLTKSSSESVTNMTITEGGALNSNYEENLNLLLVNELRTHIDLGGAYDGDMVYHRLPLSGSDKATFDISKDFALKYHLPPDASINSAGTIYDDAPDCYKLHRLFYAQSYGDPAVDELLTQTLTTEYVALWGTKQFIDNETDWYAAQTKNAIWLTNQLRTKELTEDSPEYWYFFPKLASASDYDIKVKETYNDATFNISTKATISSLEFGKVQWLKLGFQQLGLTQNPANPTISYDVWIENSSTVISDVLTFQIVNIQTSYERHFIFGNSLAGMDVHRGTGKLMETLEISSQEAVRADNQFTANVDYARTGQTFQYDKRTTQNYKGSLGYKSKENVTYLRDLFLSDEVYVIDINTPRFTRIIIDNDSVEMGKDDQDLYSINFEYRYAFEDKGITS